MAAMGQCAVSSGSMMFFSGLSIFADSAIKSTPQKIIFSQSRVVAFFASSSESPV